LYSRASLASWFQLAALSMTPLLPALLQSLHGSEDEHKDLEYCKASSPAISAERTVQPSKVSAAPPLTRRARGVGLLFSVLAGVIGLAVELNFALWFAPRGFHNPFAPRYISCGAADFLYFYGLLLTSAVSCIAAACLLARAAASGRARAAAAYTFMSWGAGLAGAILPPNNSYTYGCSAGLSRLSMDVRRLDLGPVLIALRAALLLAGLIALQGLVIRTIRAFEDFAKQSLRGRCLRGLLRSQQAILLITCVALLPFRLLHHPMPGFTSDLHTGVLISGGSLVILLVLVTVAVAMNALVSMVLGLEQAAKAAEDGSAARDYFIGAHGVVWLQMWSLIASLVTALLVVGAYNLAFMAKDRELWSLVCACAQMVDAAVATASAVWVHSSETCQNLSGAQESTSKEVREVWDGILLKGFSRGRPLSEGIAKRCPDLECLAQHAMQTSMVARKILATPPAQSPYTELDALD